MDSDELEPEDAVAPANSQTVRKSIALKLKGKGKGGRAARGKPGRPKKAEARETLVQPPTLENVKLEDSPPDAQRLIERKAPKYDMAEEDIFKLEAPTFTTIDRGPPQPTHRNVQLCWNYKVNLIGAKVMNPMIHCCQKCQLPILLYGRMIPCKHVFCFDCARKAEKVCPRCTEKVVRVEQTGLGTLFMCNHGGTRKSGSDGCSRTYLSQRDLQAHINHRHCRQPSSGTAKSSSGTNRSSSSGTSSHHHPQQQSSQQQQHSSDQRSSTRSSHKTNVQQQQQQMQPPPNPTDLSSYRSTHQQPIQQQQQHSSGMVQQQLYGSEHIHRNYQQDRAIMVAAVSSMSHQVAQQQQAQPQQNLLSPYVAAANPQLCLPVSAATAAPVVYGNPSSMNVVVNSVQANLGVAPPSRITSNLITVPIHDNSGGVASANAAADYMYHAHQRAQALQQQQQQQQQQPQQTYLPLVGQHYSAPPPVSYQTTYCTPTLVTSYQQAPHYPPPPIYSAQMPPPPAHQGPPRYSVPPPQQRYVAPPPTGQPPTQYDEHAQHVMAGAQFQQAQWPPAQLQPQQQQRVGGGVVQPPPSHPPPMGHPQTVRPPFY